MITHSETAAIRDASRHLVRELGFLQDTLAGTHLPPSAVHALVEIGARGSTTAVDLCDALLLEKSSVSRMLRKLVDGGEVASVAHDDDGRAKRLMLTKRGRATLYKIDRYARSQVEEALARLPSPARACVSEGLSAYARALAARRAEQADATDQVIEIVPGYRSGVIGRAVEMHARFYSRMAGFGRVFEGKVAADMAAFAERLDQPCNELWSASIGGVTVGTIAIDGEDLGASGAHLRWFMA